MKTALTTTALALGLGVTSVHAALVGYTDRTSFDNALAALSYSPTEHTFDGLPEGDISIGTAYDGITFTSASLAPATGLRVQGNPPTPTQTPENQIGTTEGVYQNAFRDGDGFAFSFAPSVAIGLYFQEALPINFQSDDFYSLTVGSETQGILASAGTPLGQSATNVWFVGIIDDSGATFTSAAVSSTDIGGDQAQWTADTFITGAVPVPATIVLVALGLGVFGVGRRWRQG